MNSNRQPKGVPVGGQFATCLRAEPGAGLHNGLHVDKEAANNFADQVEAIQQEGLQGALSGHDDKLTFTSNDGVTLDIHQDGHTDEDGNPGWSIDNHECADADDPAYGIRVESRTANLGEDLAHALAQADANHAFTLNAGSERYDFRDYSVHDGESATAGACFMDMVNGEDLNVTFNHDTGTMQVDRNGEELTGEAANDALRDLVDSVDLDSPDGSASEQMAWHMERSFRIAAAKPDSPAWMHPYRVSGLSWEDRHEGR